MCRALFIFIVMAAAGSGYAEALLEWDFHGLTGAASTNNRVFPSVNKGERQTWITRLPGMKAGPAHDHSWSLSLASAGSLSEAMRDQRGLSFQFYTPRADRKSHLRATLKDLVLRMVPQNSEPDQIHLALFGKITPSLKEEQLGETVTVAADGSGAPLEFTLPDLNLSGAGTITFRLFLWSSSNAMAVALGVPKEPAGVSLSGAFVTVPGMKTAWLMMSVLVGLFVVAGARSFFFRRARHGR